MSGSAQAEELGYLGATTKDDASARGVAGVAKDGADGVDDGGTSA